VTEPVADRKYEIFSLKLKAGASEPVKDLKSVNLSVTAEAEDSAPASDLKKEDFCTRVEAELKVPANVLNNDVCSVSVVVEPTNTPRFSVLPVKSELPRVIEPVNVLR
jgi:hypothetical protein